MAKIMARLDECDVYISLLLCFSVSQKLLNQDGEFAVVRTDEHYEKLPPKLL